jgi:hypothetical protein
LEDILHDLPCRIDHCTQREIRLIYLTRTQHRGGRKNPKSRAFAPCRYPPWQPRDTRSICLTLHSMCRVGGGDGGWQPSGGCKHAATGAPSQTSTIPYYTMGVLPSTQPVATLGSSFILSSFDVACTIQQLAGTTRSALGLRESLQRASQRQRWCQRHPRVYTHVAAYTSRTHGSWQSVDMYAAYLHVHRAGYDWVTVRVRVCTLRTCMCIVHVMMGSQ